MEELSKYDEFAKRMEAKFPKMLGQGYGGFAIGEGWWVIVERLMDNIQSHTDWKNKQRQREVDKFTAREQGYEALLKFYSGGMREPSDWEIKQADETMASGVTIPKEVQQVEVQQIKEKFGGLRFYYSGGDEEISGMVQMAESWAGVACEDCGGIGTRRSGGWIRNLCDKHEAEYQDRKQLKV